MARAAVVRGGGAGRSEPGGGPLKEVAWPRPPGVWAWTEGEYVLHPSLLDAALQASVGLELGQQVAGGLHLPFALDEVEVFAPSPPRGWAWVRYGSGSTAGSAVRKLDIDLCDEQGRV